MTSAIEPVSFLPPATGLQDDLVAPPITVQPSGPSFADWFTQEIGNVNTKIAASDQQLQALATGETDNLHQVMLSLEEARLSFQLIAQVRNKLLESYQDLMRMQL